MTKQTIKTAKRIRSEAAAKYGCSEKEIIWSLCIKAAIEELNEKGINEEEVLQVVIGEHKRLCKENKRRAGSVTIPEMADIICEEYEISLETFQALLKKWQEECKIGLWVCDAPRLEERASEGIKVRAQRSGFVSLLFYIRLV